MKQIPLSMKKEKILLIQRCYSNLKEAKTAKKHSNKTFKLHQKNYKKKQALLKNKNMIFLE